MALRRPAGTRSSSATAVNDRGAIPADIVSVARVVSAGSPLTRIDARHLFPDSISGSCGCLHPTT